MPAGALQSSPGYHSARPSNQSRGAEEHILDAELTNAGAGELARWIKEKRVSASEVVAAHLERIRAVQPQLNAFVDVDADRAMDQARAVDTSKATTGDKPLLGVPVSIKSSIDVAGLRCAAGTKLRADYVAASDAPLVARLKNAGAIVLGNTNTPEVLMAYETNNTLYGRTSNPWDLERSAGGSSGGESAAIAAGCVVAGVGSDGGGSIRVPAHFTGICGLKPTPGRIPATQHFPQCVGPSAMLGVVGPMARTIADLKIMLAVMSGYDAGDPMSADFVPPEGQYDPKRCRIACLSDSALGKVSAETRAALYAAAAALERAGCMVEEFTPAGLEEAEELWRVLFCELGAMLVRQFVGDRTDQLSPMLKGFLATFPGEPPLTGERLIDTLIRRDLLRARFLEQIKAMPVLLTPVSTGPAFRHGEGGWTRADPANYLETMRFTQWFNLLGFPGVVVPVSKSAEGLPIGVQVVGRPHEEEVALEVAALVEREFGFKAPPMNWAAPGRHASTA